MAERHTRSWTETVVRHRALPLGASRENGPHLADLREFVQACDGLPGDLLVSINNGSMSESGRYDTEFRITYKVPTEDEVTE